MEWPFKLILISYFYDTEIPMQLLSDWEQLTGHISVSSEQQIPSLDRLTVLSEDELWL